MKRAFMTIFLLLGASGLSYGIYYQSAVQHSAKVARTGEGGILWLKDEFQLSGGQFAVIAELHSEFEARCDLMCQRIIEADKHLASLMRAEQEVTEEIRMALERDVALRKECRLATLEHIYEVSRVMSPDQGKRYVELITARLMHADYDHTEPVFR